MNRVELAALDHEFNYGGKMDLMTYNARRKEICARAPDEAALKANETAEGDKTFVTLACLSKTLAHIAKVINEYVSSPLHKRIALLEAKSNERGALGVSLQTARNVDERSVKEIDEKISAEVKECVARALAPFATRLSTVETRTGALSMMLGKGEAAGKIAEFETLSARINALEDRLPLAYGGIWAGDKQSAKGVFYTHSGSIWFCLKSSFNRPSESADFVLACKRGRDAKDAR
jgi:hypothetical protein